MAKRVRTFLVLLSCLHLCVGVDAMLQVVAWSRMLVDYSAQAGLAEGMTMTFDGQHPCCMCNAIAENRKRQQDKNQELPGVISLRLVLKEFVPPGTTTAPTPRAVDFPDCGFVPLASSGSIYAEGPPVPPPRESAV
ncbi:MAG: hypothetical protein V4819_11660 [Verrucomicrobiota bacterium]